MITELLADLAAESELLDRSVAGLTEADFARPTPSPGWSIAHQIAHLAWTDAAALTAVTQPQEFQRVLVAAAEDPYGFIDAGAEAGAALPTGELLAGWRTGRERLAAALRSATGRIVWFGTTTAPATMAPASMVTARLMETWAHSLDVADALGENRPFTPRLRHVAHLGWRTLGHGFATHGRTVPTEPVHLVLSTPDDSQWTFGPPGAADRVAGPALDFCLLVTQRRNPADLALTATGPVATQWLEVAQAYAGPPGARRAPAAS
jgi:uncharacterized protein (TIGR03084 family)